MSLPAGYYRAANGYIYDAQGNGPFYLTRDGAIGDTEELTLDAFQRLRVSLPSSRFDSQQEYGLDTLRTWTATANGTMAAQAVNGSVSSAGNAVGPRDANTRMTPVTSSATDTHYAILQANQYTRYVPGKSHLVLMTGVFAAAAPSEVAIVRRTSTSGSVVDTRITQANWNVDKFDGTGPSGVTLDLTKTHILVISAQWLGVGRVVVGFDINGIIYPAHAFLNANSLIVPYTQTFNLPVRMETRTAESTTLGRTGYFDAANGIFLETVAPQAGGTLNFVCCSVQSEGGEDVRGFPFSAFSGSVSVTTRRPVLSIRPATTFQGITNRAHAQLADAWLSAGGNSAVYEIVIGGTLTGASFAALTNSCIEVDTAATAITGGGVTYSGEAAAGSGSVRGFTGKELDFRNPLVLRQIDALTATQQPVSIVATSTSGTATVRAGLNWHELTN